MHDSRSAGCRFEPSVTCRSRANLWCSPSEILSARDHRTRWSPNARTMLSFDASTSMTGRNRLVMLSGLLVD